jgi:predicted N-acyltransferase
MKAELQGELVLRAVTSMTGFSREEWSGLAYTSAGSADDYNPFVDYSFLWTLEEAGCATADTGWLGQHLRLESEDGRLIGAVPCYLKSHSQGEYIFDHGWADAFQRAGGRYYPKLQSSVPFTPATGPRLLVSKCENSHAIQPALARGLRTLCEQRGTSSVHVTFVPPDEAGVLDNAGFLRRTDQQFHFFNENFGTYDDFLATLSSRKRKNLKRERREALQNGITIRWLTGNELTESVWDTFFRFYMDTGSRKWGRPYLNRKFFSLIGERMADHILLIMAERAGRYIAGALNFIGSDTLYGRHWGCIEHHNFLHFEVCYHQAIDFAIARGLKVVEAGAQGEHKLARGYQPVTTYSAHYIPNVSFRNAVAQYLEHERADVREMGKVLQRHTPFRKGE